MSISGIGSFEPRSFFTTCAPNRPFPEQDPFRALDTLGQTQARATSETLIPSDLKARLREAAAEIKVERARIPADAESQSGLSLQISAPCLTGLTGASLWYHATQAGNATAEVQYESGERQELPIRPKSAYFDSGHEVTLPDGSRFQIKASNESNAIDLERLGPEGTSLRARLLNPDSEHGSASLQSLIASNRERDTHAGLHEFEPGTGMQFHLTRTDWRSGTSVHANPNYVTKTHTRVSSRRYLEESVFPSSFDSQYLYEGAKSVANENQFLSRYPG